LNELLPEKNEENTKDKKFSTYIVHYVQYAKRMTYENDSL